MMNFLWPYSKDGNKSKFVSLLTCARSGNTCSGAGIGPKPMSDSDTTRRQITPCFFLQPMVLLSLFNLFLAKFYGLNWGKQCELWEEEGNGIRATDDVHILSNSYGCNVFVLVLAAVTFSICLGNKKRIFFQSAVPFKASWKCWRFPRDLCVLKIKWMAYLV